MNRILFFLSGSDYSSYHTSDQNYEKFFSAYFSKNGVVPDGYCFADVANLPSIWDINRDFTFLTDGYEGYYRFGEFTGHNFYASVNLLSSEKNIVRLDVERTVGEKIGTGFAFAGQQFSLSQNAQLKWSGLFASKDFLTYPINVSNIDDTDGYDILDASAVTAMYLAGVTVVRQALDNGNSVKVQIRNCDSLQNLDDIIDANFNSSDAIRLKYRIS